MKNGGGKIFIFFNFFLSLLSSIYGVSTVGICRAKNKSSSTRRGLHVSTKTRDFAEISIKNSENPMFWFFSDVRHSEGQNWSDQELKLFYSMRATCGY